MSYFPVPSEKLEGAVELKVCERHGGLFYRSDKDQKYCKRCLRRWPNLRSAPRQVHAEAWWNAEMRRVM